MKLKKQAKVAENIMFNYFIPGKCIILLPAFNVYTAIYMFTLFYNKKILYCKIAIVLKFDHFNIPGNLYVRTLLKSVFNSIASNLL